MRCGRRTRIASLLAVAGLVLAPIAAAHANHVEADPQVVADDRVRIEAAFPLLDGWLVVHVQNGSGGIGEAIGHVAVDPDDGFRTDVAVPVDGNATTNRSWVAALHVEETGSGFDPGDDPVVTRLDEPVTSSFPVESGPSPVYIGAETFRPTGVEDGTVTIRRVALAEDGSLTLQKEATGEQLGVADLDAGVHRNVTVDVDPASLPTGDRTRLQATVHDGDGVVRVAGEPVSTVFAIERIDVGEDADGGGAPRSIPGPGGLAVLVVLTVVAGRRRPGGT